MEITGVLLCLFSFVFVGTKCDDDDAIYAIKMTDSIYSCDNFDNGFLDCSKMVLAADKGDDGDEAKLCGKMISSADLLCDYDIEIDIWKVQDMSDEYMYNMKMSFGSSLKDPDAPWAPVFQTLNITECPVPSNTYEVAELKLSLNCVQDVLSHDFVGNYRLQFSVVDVTEKMSCHILYISIIEVE